MIELLDTNAQRMSHIIKELGENREWCKTEDLAGLLNVSRRTVVSDLKIIRDRWGELLDYESCSKNGIRINNHSLINQETISKTLVSESVSINLIELVFTTPYRNLDFYADELYTSRSTLLRSIPKINSFFSKLKFKIHFDQNGYYFMARNEVHLRKFFARFFTELYDTNITQYKSELNYEFINQIVQKEISERKYAVNEVTYSLYSFMVIVSLTRENQGFKFDMGHEHENIMINKNTLQTFLHDFPYINEDSIRSLEFGVMDFRHCTDSDNYDKILCDAINAFMNQLEQEFKIEIDKDNRSVLQMFLCNLYFKFQTYPFRSSFLFDRVGKLSDSIQKENPHFMEKFSPIVRDFASILSLSYSQIINDLIYFTVAQLPQILIKPIGIKSILYLSNLGKDHGDFVSRLIKGTFYFYNNISEIEIEVAIHDEPLHKEYLNQYDCILTTLPNLNYPLDHILQINDYPTDQDLFNLFQLLKKD